MSRQYNVMQSIVVVHTRDAALNVYTISARTRMMMGT